MMVPAYYPDAREDVPVLIHEGAAEWCEECDGLGFLPQHEERPDIRASLRQESNGRWYWFGPPDEDGTLAEWPCSACHGEKRVSKSDHCMLCGVKETAYSERRGIDGVMLFTCLDCRLEVCESCVGDSDGEYDADGKCHGTVRCARCVRRDGMETG